MKLICGKIGRGTITTLTKRHENLKTSGVSKNEAANLQVQGTDQLGGPPTNYMSLSQFTTTRTIAETTPYIGCQC